MEGELVTHSVFAERPSEEYLDAWRKHIDETGYPETFQHVSTSKPLNADGLQILSAELRVPTTRRIDGEWVPCPICSPNSPKFAIGRMSWFPAEQAVRFIGHRCAATHYGETFHEADRRFRKEATLRRYVRRWAAMVQNYDRLAAFAQELMPSCDGLQSIREHLYEEANGFCELLRGALDRRSGAIVEPRDTGLRDPRTGRPVYEDVHLGTVSGLSFLSDGFVPATHVRSAIATINDLEHPLPEWDPAAHDDTVEAQIIARGMAADRIAQILLEEAERASAAQQFFTDSNFSLLERAAGMLGFEKIEMRSVGRQLSLRASSFRGGHYSRPFWSTALTPVPRVQQWLRDLVSGGRAVGSE